MLRLTAKMADNKRCKTNSYASCPQTGVQTTENAARTVGLGTLLAWQQQDEGQDEILALSCVNSVSKQNPLAPLD